MSHGLFTQRAMRNVLLAGQACLLILVASPSASPAAADDDELERFFETEIRPVLAERCVECHGEQEQSNGLRLDSREAILNGGDAGPALVPGKPDESLLLKAVRREGDLEMPPDEPLSKAQIAALSRWVELNAYWPESSAQISSSTADKGAGHWAFQPVVKPDLPPTADDQWVRTPVDAFVLARLQEAGLAHSPEADRRTLIRRLTYSLTGLPPTPEDVDAFVSTDDPHAYEQLVERLLDSPHYGEQWARHWLDVARYSDTKGYVYAREERFWVHAWTYRDWVVNALNDDMPYDRFLLLQIAADQVEDRRLTDLAAMGFLTVGRRFLGVERDIIDDRIDVVTRGTMGLSVACARCHDHKYDPIPTADYYSLYGVFDSSREEYVRLEPEPSGDEAFESELAKRREALQTRLAAARAEWSDRVRERVGDYLRAQLELHEYPPQGFDQVLEKSDILPAFVRRWQAYLRDARRTNDPIFAAWHAYRDIPEESFAAQAADVTRNLQSATEQTNPLVAAEFTTPPNSFAEVVDRYAALFARINAQWKSQLEAAAAAGEEPPTQLDEPAAEQLRRVLYGPGAPCVVPNEPIVHTEDDFDSATCTEIWNLQGEVDRWIINSPLEVPFALTLADRDVPSEPVIFRRGNPTTPGDDVPRQMLSVIAGEERTPFEHGSGRLELAQAIIDPSNPLTARVIVNRVWTHHFGTGLVDTPSDFGARAETPSHPTLLDWLAARFIEEGWSLKQLHRWIVLSSTFRQSSFASTNPTAARAKDIDPDNRLLWRMNPRRLSFEEFRDSLLAASGQLDRSVGGKPSELFKAPFPTRRTLYGLIDRQFLPSTLRMFDFANPDLHIPQRNETIVPQQALFVMNDPLMLDRARAAAAQIPDESSAPDAIRTLFRSAYQREPTHEERQWAIEFLHASQPADAKPRIATAADWSYGYGLYAEDDQRVPEFTPLPHFTGQAWQGGPAWPDPALGWVQLTAAGGHPGNDRAHACIRRWTAPRPMTVTISSHLVHEAPPGDGIRAFVISSRAGLLASATVHQQSADMNVESLNVAPGETIDFLVDIGDVLNSDQYRWEATITAAGADSEPVVWNSKADFSPNDVQRLTPLEQLAQVLLCSNEFLFVD